MLAESFTKQIRKFGWRIYITEIERGNNYIMAHTAILWPSLLLCGRFCYQGLLGRIKSNSSALSWGETKGFLELALKMTSVPKPYGFQYLLQAQI